MIASSRSSSVGDAGAPAAPREVTLVDSMPSNVFISRDVPSATGSAVPVDFSTDHIRASIARRTSLIAQRDSYDSLSPMPAVLTRDCVRETWKS
jgi:hypothetical protein